MCVLHIANRLSLIDGIVLLVQRNSSSLSCILLVTGIPSSALTQLTANFKLKRKDIRIVAGAYNETTTVGESANHSSLPLDGLIKREPHPLVSDTTIMVRHYVSSDAVVSQSLFTDTGNKQVIRRFISEGSLMVEHEMSIRSTGEMIICKLVYTKK
jgi:hypothetical protein